jgi:hypothetical protein
MPSRHYSKAAARDASLARLTQFARFKTLWHGSRPHYGLWAGTSRHRKHFDDFLDAKSGFENFTKPKSTCAATPVRRASQHRKLGQQVKRYFRSSFPTICFTSWLFSLQMYSMISEFSTSGECPYMVNGLV